MAARSVNGKARKVLTLKEKVEVLKYVSKNPGSSSRKVSDVFNCGKTQIQCILKNKEGIMHEFEKNAPKRHRTEDNADVNEAVYSWYCLARERNIRSSSTGGSSPYC